jgi:hypothetical protein
MKPTIIAAIALIALATPGWSQQGTKSKPAPANPDSKTSVQNDTTSPGYRDLQDTDVQFVDAPDAYWVNRGFNDTIFGSSGSVNAVRSERNQSRDDEIFNKLKKPQQKIEVLVNGKSQDSSLNRFRPRKLDPIK